ncbi:uncharacterized acetyltransferase At3g50280-like [Papaver somniferum]|uniref:uncharacterized acetyltransferase At3g50280-like n=1 Tax=Papaver somniferum TaxID=3469 RepID=UPI000E6FF0BA|nr:uncharacterized acetyltransferase At3g50280-like [Papaver somniferum]
MDILTPIDVPRIVQSFFALEGAINHDGHAEPLLAVQVAELLDGIFVGCSSNHVVGDGTYWKFFNSFAEVSRKLRKTSKAARDYHHFDCSISHPPITKLLYLAGHGDIPLINLPFSHHGEFFSRCTQPPLRERMFYFTAESIAKIKSKANEECNAKRIQISSFKALSAHLASGHDPVVNSRSTEGTDSACTIMFGTTTSGELINNGIGWATLLLPEAIKEHTDEKIRGSIEEWMKTPHIFQLARVMDDSSMLMGSSLRFDVYGCDFGLGKALAARSGYANKLEGMVSSYIGLTGTGSVMLEVCLPPESMTILESDKEFMDVASPHDIHSFHLACV